jgi:GT2 family glycosyltransferase
MITLIVPVLKNFPGFAELMSTIDLPVRPIIIQNWQQNVGVANAWNAGIERSIYESAEVAIICNDDVRLFPGTLEKMVTGLGRGYDLVSAVNSRDHPISDIEGYAVQPDFSCFVIRPQPFVERHGKFDANFTPAYFEDNDMAYRMRLAGNPGVARTDAGMFHVGSVTQNWDGKPLVDSTQFQRNRMYYVQKWGGPPGQERFTNPFDDSTMTWKDCK